MCLARPGPVHAVMGCCAAQLGDRPRLDANLGNFESFNEPFYGSYIKEDFGAARPLPAGSSVARRSSMRVMLCMFLARVRELLNQKPLCWQHMASNLPDCASAVVLRDNCTDCRVGCVSVHQRLCVPSCVI